MPNFCSKTCPLMVNYYSMIYKIRLVVSYISENWGLSGFTDKICEHIFHVATKTVDLIFTPIQRLTYV